ncbi:SLOG family protein [Dysgonomonas sp. ZJ709]|uniref:SLOG family protein n=1 Tax=Dysgonomonas sp. ZJ709 TaxID=2709797 RepID=UPI0013ED85DC|nr:SLOG family protein [Dysgonomonas sp. ZJ709]
MKNNKSKTIAFTGHQKITENPEDLSDTLHALIIDFYLKGYRIFLSGVSEGFDLLAAEEVIKLKESYPEIRLHCIIPFRGQAQRFYDSDKERYESVLSATDRIECLSEFYYEACFFRRNDYLVNNASQMIVYYDEWSKGDVSYTVNHAQERGIPVINLFDFDMEVFNFYQDEQIKGWGRSTFYVKAFSYEQALEAIRLLNFRDVNELNKKTIVPLSYEYLTEPVETFSLKDNKEIKTIEYYSIHDTSNPLFTNKDNSLVDDRRNKINELSCLLAEKKMVDVFRMLPEEFKDKNNTEVYAEVYQRKFDEYYDDYFALLEKL